MSLNPALRRRIAQAQAGIKKDPIIRDGQYIMLIQSMQIIDASVTGVGDMFAGKLRVERATAVTQGVEPNPVGSDCAIKTNLSTNRAAMSTVKGMVAGALGYADPNAIGEEDWNRILDWVFSDQQPMRGMLVAGDSFRTTIKQGKNAGQPFVGVNWSQVQQTPAEIAQRRAQLDAIDAQKPQQPAQPQPPQQFQQQQYHQQPQAPFGQQPQPPAFGQQPQVPFGQQVPSPQFQQPQQFGGGQPPPPQFGQPPAFGQQPLMGSPLQQPQYAPQSTGAPPFGQQPQRQGW